MASREVQTCLSDDDVHTAMAIMRRAKVHRLPVVSDGRKLEGIVSLNDLVRAADRKHGEIDYEEVMNTVKAVSEHRGHKPAEPKKLNSGCRRVAPGLRDKPITQLNERRTKQWQK